jgi:hypothetical protein
VLFAVLASVLVLVINAAMAARSPAPARQLAEQSYLDQALPAIHDSTQQGRALDIVRAQAIHLSGPTITARINGVVKQSQQTLDAVARLGPPASIKVPHALLVAALDLRYQAAKSLGQAIATALSGQPLDTGVRALGEVGLDFQAADRAYQLFQQAMPRLDVAPPDSKWVSDAAAYSSATLSVFVAGLRSASNTAQVIDVAVVLVTTEPQPVNLQGPLQILPVARFLNLQIVAGNTGNQAERNMTVTAAVVPSAIGPAQSVREFVNLEPGQTRTVALGGLRVQPGQPTTLTVRIDAAPGEVNVGDNVKVINLQMQ